MKLGKDYTNIKILPHLNLIYKMCWEIHFCYKFSDVHNISSRLLEYRAMVAHALYLMKYMQCKNVSKYCLLTEAQTISAFCKAICFDLEHKRDLIIYKEGSCCCEAVCCQAVMLIIGSQPIQSLTPNGHFNICFYLFIFCDMSVCQAGGSPLRPFAPIGNAHQCFRGTHLYS